MALIRVHKAPQSAWNPNRPMSSLLASQVEHLHKAEQRLPIHHRTDIYVNAIRSEGEASEYIRAVTEAIHNAHAEAEARRTQRFAPPRPGRIAAIAAQADETAAQKTSGRAKKKAQTKSSAKPKGKK